MQHFDPVDRSRCDIPERDITGRKRSYESVSVRRYRLLPPLLLLALSAALILSYWPGIMTWDPIEQYDQAVQNSYADWHPPIMAWIWHFLIPIAPGTAPMFVLQLLLYLGGYALLAGWALNRGQPGVALAFAAGALMPIPMALMGSVLKDCLMTGALLSAVGLFVWRERSPNRLLLFAAIILLVFAATLRFNAFPAAAPLIVALLSPAWRRTWIRLVATSLVTISMLLLAGPIVNRLLDAERTGVEYTQIIFDLAGITEYSGVDVFPPLPVTDVLAINHRCYTPEFWDNYSSWDDPPTCRINFDEVRQAVADSGWSPYGFWLRAVAAHPLAYAEHRLTHLAVNLRILVPAVNYRPAPDRSIENDWHFDFQSNPVELVVDRAAVITDRTPLGWPICWLALAFGIMMLARRLPSRRIIVPIALSVIFYGLSYAVISVASDLRYHLWTMIGTLIAAIIAAGDIARDPAIVPRRRLLSAAAPMLVTASACLIARLV